MAQKSCQLECKMTDFTSDSQTILHSRQLVYDTLSNMENLARIKERLPEDKVRDVRFERDACSFSVPPLGALRVVIADRKSPDMIQWAVEKAPVNANLRIQLASENETETRIQLTLSADLNPFIKPMLSKPLQEGINKMAHVLTTLPYDELQG
jgi:hypothetical protein